MNNGNGSSNDKDLLSKPLHRSDGGATAGTGSLEHLVPRRLAREMLATETAYEDPKPSFMDVLLDLQSQDVVTVDLKAK